VRYYFVIGLMLAAILLSAQPAHAVLELVTDVGTAAGWPVAAPVRTSVFESGGGSRGVRLERFQYQTFSVAEAFSLDKLFVEYQWQGNFNAGAPLETNAIKFRLVEITRTYGLLTPPVGDPYEIENGFTIGTEIIPATPFVANPIGKTIGARYAFEIDWDAETSGELILLPRTGAEGYALEFNGTYSTSSIALIQRGDNPYPDQGRAWEFQSGSEQGPFVDGKFDFPMVLTAVPPPFLDGDFNQDGTVDAADYVMWRKTNESDMDAYGDWVRNFGMSNGGGGGVEAGGVPEPAALLLIAPVAALGYVASLRRREKCTVGVVCHVTNLP
jgi:hypothetical protein